MKSKVTITLLLLTQITFSQAPKKTAPIYKEDFDYFWKTIDEEYCYFNKKQTYWAEVKKHYSPMFDTIQTREQFVTTLEKVFYELYDHHASLNTNTDFSRRLVPSGTDIWVEYKNGKPVIIEIKQNSKAEAAHILAGMEVIAVNGIPVAKAVQPYIGKSLKAEDLEAKNYALRLLLAGNHVEARKITLKSNGVLKDYYPDQSGLQLDVKKEVPRIESFIKDSFGYIKINDCLYDNELVPVFDSIMRKMQSAKGLVLDLRNTGSGGNTVVAKAILSWFITKECFYQKHEYYAEEKVYGIKRSWVEIVSPRKNASYDKPLAVLVDHWTGSVGEAITIGFDSFNRPKTTIIGTELARLNGAVNTFEMPNTKIHFTFPVERLYRVDGLPREQYVPKLFIDYQKESSSPNGDPFLAKAIHFLKSN
jgi:carboxyl-terminal processing protease